MHFLTALIPFWLFLLVVILGTFTAIELFRYRRISSDLRKQNDSLIAQCRNAETLNEKLKTSNKDLEAEKQRLEQQVAELTRSGPRLHGVWNNSQTFWHLSRRGTEPVMHIGGRIHLSSSKTDEVLHLLAAYIEGQRLELAEPVSVRPDLIEDEQVVLYTSPSLEADATRSFTATIVLEDHQNRLYNLPSHTFRPAEQVPSWATQDLS